MFLFLFYKQIGFIFCNFCKKARNLFAIILNSNKKRIYPMLPGEIQRCETYVRRIFRDFRGSVNGFLQVSSVTVVYVHLNF